MSATELIERVAALPAAERAIFGDLFRALERGEAGGLATGLPRWPDFDARLRQIYGDKVVADSQSLIDETRGDR